MATKQYHQSIDEVKDSEAVLEASVEVSRDLSLKFRELPVPEWLKETTKAKNLGEYIQFERQGDVIVKIILNALPVLEGILTPSVYGRRMKAVYALFSAFAGDIAGAGTKEVIMAFNPKLPYVEKVRYTFNERAGHWLEWNWLRTGFVPSGRRQFSQDERVRVSGIRIPQTVVNELDAIAVLLTSGCKIEIGLSEQENFADWAFALLSGDGTLGDYLNDRKERWAAKAANAAVQNEITHQPGKSSDVTMVVIDGNAKNIQLVEDGTYVLHLPGAAPTNITLDKSDGGDSIKRWQANARRGGSFTTPKE